MTNKNEMPVVGKRYYPKYPAPYYSAVFQDSFAHGDQLLYRFDCIYKDSGKAGYFSIPIEDFYACFVTSNDFAIDEVKVNGIEEALHDLKECVDNESVTKYNTVFAKARKLINAIENTDVIKTCPNCKWNYFSLLTDPTKFCSPDCEAESEGVKVPCVGANCGGCNCEKEKHKSLWKDVMKFKLNDLKHYLLKRKSGEIIIFSNDHSGLEYLAKFDEDKLEFSEFCSMNDIIEAFENLQASHEQLQRDVEEIKRKIK